MRYLPLVIFIFSLTSVHSQPGHQIKFKIEGWKDTTIYLGHYYLENAYVSDTARVNSKGEFQFQGEKPLPHGMYFLVLGKSRVLDFVVGSSQYFSMKSKSRDIVASMMTANTDNKFFYENMLYSAERNKEAAPYLAVLKDQSSSQADKNRAQEFMNQLNERVRKDQDQQIAKYGKTTTSILLKSSRPVQIPETPTSTSGKRDSTFRLRWYREHYFDNFDLSSEALLRLPTQVYRQKIDDYLDNLFIQHPDTLLPVIHRLIANAKGNQETYKYCTFTIFNKYSQPKYMGLDEVYVRMYDTYFETGEMDFWLDQKSKKNIKEYADKLRKSLIGNTAPDLVMLDQDLKPRSMYATKSKYTLLYIFDPDCAACKEETPKLVEFYTRNKLRYNLEVFAVSVDTSMAKMKNYISTMKMEWITVNGPRTYVGHYLEHYDADRTPSLFVIDEKRKIIAKGIEAEKLEDFLKNYERISQIQRQRN